MTRGGHPDHDSYREALVRHRRLAALDDLLPCTSSDDLDETWGDRPDDESRERDLLRDVPPHHDS